MDIVSRIKYFMNFAQISSSQIADTCKIPRPTISQILNGRNKKISDEIINKIHIAYPKLSMLWLMFGEGDMMLNSNIKISESQNPQSISFYDSTNIDNEDIIPTLDFNSDSSENLSENQITDSSIDTKPQNDESVATSSIGRNAIKAIPPLETDTTKKIVNILVFYNDNSFESFIPSRNK